MTAVAYAATHTIAGNLENGNKIVFSHIVGDLGTAGITPVVVDPLRRINGWWMGVRSPGNTATTFEVVCTGGTSGANVIYITAAGDTATSGAEIDVISFGVG